MMAAWGQLMAHDVSRVTAHEPAESLPVGIPCCDERWDADCACNKTMPFSRAKYEPTSGGGAASPRAIVNAVTHFLDASTVYGSSVARQSLLRSFSRGRMLVGDDGVPLPMNTGGAEVDGPFDDTAKRLMGDVRGNVAPGLLVLHALLVAEHNRVADKLWGEHPTWSDEQLFQEARLRVIAVVQAISINEYLPALLGEPLEAYTGYQPSTQPDVSLFFTIAAFRYGHSGINSVYARLDENWAPHPAGDLLLRDVYFQPSYLLDGGIEPILRGLLWQLENEIDLKLVDDVRHFLKGVASDLMATDIQRGRDAGLVSYSRARQLHGLPPPIRFSDITSDTALAAALSQAYGGDVTAVDAWVGGMAEDHRPNSLVGPLFHAAIKAQWRRTRAGDPFWYENIFNGDELMELRGTTLAALIARNTNIQPPSSAAFRQARICATEEAESQASTSTGGSTELLNGRVQLSWAPSGAQGGDGSDGMTFTVRARTDHWFGFGVGNGMADADMVIAYFNSAGEPVVKDTFSTQLAVLPPDDAQDDCTLLSASREDGWLAVSWARPLSNSDSMDYPILDEEAKYLVAIGGAEGDGTPSYHGPDRATFRANLLQEGSTATGLLNTLVYGRGLFHGILMLIGWTVLAPLSAVAARILTFKSYWLELHSTLASLLTAATVSDSLALVTLNAVAGSYSHSHSIIGTVIVAGSLVDYLLGKALKYTIRLKTNSYPRAAPVLRIAHALLSHVLLVLALVNVYLGVALLAPSWLPLLAGWYALLIAALVAGELWHRFGRLNLWTRNAVSKLRYRRYASNVTTLPLLTASDVAAELRLGRKLVLFEGGVYNIAPLLKIHPGGAFVLHSVIGQDIGKFLTGSEAGWGAKAHAHTVHAMNALRHMLVGRLSVDEERRIATAVSATAIAVDSTASAPLSTRSSSGGASAAAASGSFRSTKTGVSSPPAPRVRMSLLRARHSSGAGSKPAAIAPAPTIAAPAPVREAIAGAAAGSASAAGLKRGSGTAIDDALAAVSGERGGVTAAELAALDLDSGADGVGGLQRWKLVARETLGGTPDEPVVSFTFDTGCDRSQEDRIGRYFDLIATKRRGEVRRSYDTVDLLDMAPTHVQLWIKLYRKGSMCSILSSLRPGDGITARGPFYSSAIRPLPRDSTGIHLAVAGGTCLHPVLNLMKQYIENYDELTLHRLVVIVSFRFEESIVPFDWLEDAATACAGLSLHILVQRPSLSWSGDTGRITVAKLRELLPAADKLDAVTLCGAAKFVTSVKKSLLGYGVKEAMIGTM
eukprot:PLAT5250.2.p1 GENE.PLAT5250.2~~PLAT5250.2.p1  ORF type:complete len:1281 (+),score=740.06 PLAT5250.2:593-4435(+)